MVCSLPTRLRIGGRVCHRAKHQDPDNAIVGFSRACFSRSPRHEAAPRGRQGMKSFAAVCASLLYLTACGKPKERPILPADITDFTTLFRDNCVACHGIDGKNGPGRPLNNALYLSLI